MIDDQSASDPFAESRDEALIALVVARDREAFATLFGRFAGRIKGFMIRSGLNHGEADEAAQDVMLSVWRKADSFDPARASAAGWIFAIARNRRVDMLRRRRPEPDPEDPLFRPDPPQAADMAVSAADRDRAVRAALTELSEEQREVVRLAFFDGLSQAQIAAMTDQPLGTVKSRMRLAFGRLRAALGADFGQELLDG